MRLLLIFVGITVLTLAVAAYWVLWMPGRNAIAPANTEPQLGDLADELRAVVVALAQDIGPRHHRRPGSLLTTVEFIERRMREAGIQPQQHRYQAAGTEFVNLVAEFRGIKKPTEVIIVGAHYDTVPDCPGANDNGSGLAALLSLVHRFRNQQPARSIRFVAFANEEHPYANTPAQGSLRYAEHLKAAGENVVGMVALETIGYYSDQPGTQKYPAPLSWFYPNTGNFIAFVGDLRSRAWVTNAIAAFRRRATIPSEGVAAPRLIADISRSDHSAFWRAGYPAFMLTDTAPFRYPYYHKPSDIPEHLDYSRLARVVLGLEAMLVELAGQ